MEEAPKWLEEQLAKGIGNGDPCLLCVEFDVQEGDVATIAPPSTQLFTHTPTSCHQMDVARPSILVNDS
jgi:hypothetical protein